MAHMRYKRGPGMEAAMRALWRGIAIFLFGGVLGTGFGIALGFFFFPYVFPPPPLNEQLTQADVAPRPTAPPPVASDPNAPRPPAAVTPPGMPAPAATGTFIHANPSD